MLQEVYILRIQIHNDNHQNHIQGLSIVCICPVAWLHIFTIDVLKHILESDHGWDPQDSSREDNSMKLENGNDFVKVGDRTKLRK